MANARRMLALLSLLSAVVWPATTSAACDPLQQCCATLPDAGGSTCGGSGPATTGNSSGTPQGGGNPINVINGNKYQRKVDMPALPGVLGLEIVRHYNSSASGLNSVNGIMGRGWKLSYETGLQAKGNVLEILQADGTRLVFGRSLANPALYVSRSPAQGRVFSRRTGAGTEYTWVWSDGRRLDFDANARLVQIAVPSGEFLSLQYDPKGWLVKVTDPQGRSLELNYLDRQSARADTTRFRGVVAIDSPVGRYTYDHGLTPPAAARVSALQMAATLVKVAIPTHHEPATKTHAWSNRSVSISSVSRLYHHEDPKHPSLLTGITVNGQGSDGPQGTIAMQPESTFTTAWQLDGKGQIQADSRAVRQGAKSQFNAKGELTLTIDAVGREIHYRYDTAGHPISMADGRANTSRLSLDTEGRTMVSGLYRNGQSQPYRTSYFWRDEQGRPSQRLLPDGRIDQWTYGTGFAHAPERGGGRGERQRVALAKHRHECDTSLA